MYFFAKSARVELAVWFANCHSVPGKKPDVQPYIYITALDIYRRTRHTLDIYMHTGNEGADVDIILIQPPRVWMSIYTANECETPAKWTI